MSLATTASNRLNMQAPELSKFVVAFKDLSDELPENTGIQCGMFILDLAGKYIYVPVIAKAGNVSVLESMFDADSKTFIPITKKSVEWLLEKGHLLGKSERIPSSVARDPDLYDAIVPPKTGKFVYASEGRIGGFFSSMPDITKKATLEVITNDLAFQQAMVPVMDMNIVKAFLEPTGIEVVEEVGPPAPEVITSAAGLSEEQVQEVMSKGYTVKNPPKSKRVAVESSSEQALTRMGAMMPGTAVAAMKKDGSWTSVACLKMVPTYTDDRLSGGNMRAMELEADTGVVAVTEQGEVLLNPNIVTCNAECKYSDVVEKLTHKRATEINQGEYGMIFTGSAWYGPLKARQVSKANGWTTIDTTSHRVLIHPNVKTLLDIKGTDMIMSTSAMFYPMKEGFGIMETDINTASMKKEIEMMKMLPVEATLMHRNGVYAVDGQEIGNKPQIVEYLLKSWEIDVPTVETFVKKAESQQNVIVKMAAVRQGGRASPGSGTKVQQHYQQGDQPLDDVQMTGNARQRAMGAAGKAKGVKDVADREIMEATLISEMLQNPDLAGTINEYLPDIKQAVDRLGRSLFLMRLNTNKLSDKIDAEALNNLFTATRNAYRILGENYVELQNLVATEQ